MAPLSFTKMSGAGNDFILMDEADLKKSSQAPALARKLCPRRLSIGADGLLIVRKRGSQGLPELIYFNADGSRAFCANGSRCAAWWMHSKRWFGNQFSIQSEQGLLTGKILGHQRVCLSMPTARNLQLNLPLRLGKKIYRVSTLHTGSPHALVRVNALDDYPVLEIGRALRWHKKFAPAGTNFDFVQIEPGGVRLRTYERGVENETLACGTGAVAAALLAHLWTKRPPPIKVFARGGLLKVHFQPSTQEPFENIWLEGPAKITYHGEITL